MNNKFFSYPTKEQIIALHHRYAPSEKVFTLVFTHCQIIAGIAEQLLQARPVTVSVDLVKAGALLHDIGAYKFIDENGIFDKSNYLRHGIEGYKMLKEEGLPEELCRIAERHTGVGITQEDIIRQKLTLPLKDYVAETTEEKLIMYADKFHSKTPKFNAYKT